MRLTCSGDFGADVGAIPVTFRFKLSMNEESIRKMPRSAGPQTSRPPRSGRA